MSVGDAAQAFLRSQQGQPVAEPEPTAAERAETARALMWQMIKREFVDHRPSDDDIGNVGTISEVALAAVFDARGFDAERCIQEHGNAKDYAECAALYGFVMGCMAERLRQRKETTRSAGD